MLETLEVGVEFWFTKCVLDWIDDKRTLFLVDSFNLDSDQIAEVISHVGGVIGVRGDLHPLPAKRSGELQSAFSDSAERNEFFRLPATSPHRPKNGVYARNRVDGLSNKLDRSGGFRILWQGVPPSYC